MSTLPYSNQIKRDSGRDCPPSFIDSGEISEDLSLKDEGDSVLVDEDSLE